MLIHYITCQTCKQKDIWGCGKSPDPNYNGTAKSMRTRCKEGGCMFEVRTEDREPDDLEKLKWNLRPDRPLVKGDFI